MINKTIKKMFLLITLLILLIGAANAIETNTTISKDTDTVSNEIQPHTMKTIEKPVHKEIKKQNINNHTQNIKTATTTTKVTDYNTLKTALTETKTTSKTKTINFKKGTYNINSPITLKNQKYKIITINGNGSTINGQGKYAFLNISKGFKVTLKNITIKKCNESAIYNEGKLTITQSNLTYNYARWGGAIFNEGKLTIIQSTLKNNNAEWDGGAICNEYGTITLTQTTLKNNKAEFNGGAIDNSGNLTITNSTLQNNKAEFGGGAIHNSQGKLLIKQSTLQNNKVKGSGGAIQNAVCVTLTITQSTLNNNYAGYDGGAIDNNGKLTITQSTLNNNKVKEFRAIISHNSDTLTITNSILNNNKGIAISPVRTDSATMGMLYGSYGMKTIVNNCTLNNNTGGALDNTGNLTITNSNINNNTAKAGGAIHNYDGIITINNSTLNNNNARKGGAIYNYARMIITQSTLNNNTAEYDGGAIYNEGKLTITQTTLQNNKATKDGGAIKDSSIKSKIKNNKFINNFATNGSAISIFGENTYDSWLEKEIHYGTHVSIEGNVFIKNKAKSSGKAIINKGKDSILKNNLNENISKYSSTIYIFNSTNSSIINNRFYDEKIKTNITIPTFKQKTYKQNMTITGKLTDSTGETLKNINIKVKVNTKTYTIKTNSKGIYSLKIVANKVGTNSVTVTYAGNTYYKSITKKTTFKTVARATKLTVNKISSTTKGKKVKITGKLTDNLKSPVLNSLVKIKINKKTVKVKTNKQGVYTYYYKTTTKGTNNVTVTFSGSTNYKTSNVKSTFKVN